MATKRITIIADVNRHDERKAVREWLAKWTPRLIYLSENKGCGCCVDIFEVEAPDEAIGELPTQVIGYEPSSTDT